MILSNDTFLKLIEAGASAPSADNMQAWEFRKNNNSIEIYYPRQRALPTDVIDMFGFTGIGAAIQNIIIEADSIGYLSIVEYNSSNKKDEYVAIISLSEGNSNNNLASYISKRNTNRNPYNTEPLSEKIISILTESVYEFEGGIHWTTKKADYTQISYLDANSSYIRLEHKPLRDELFDVLRFTKQDIEKHRYGLTFESLEVPKFATLFARLLKYNSVSKIVSKLGIGKMVAKQLSDKLRKTGALCLITAENQNPRSYIETGRAMEQLWLTATKHGLSIQPYGVLPQYLTKVQLNPESFLPKYAEKINNHRKTFFSVFSDAVNQNPAILLRIGKSDKQPARSTIRLLPEQILK